MARKKSAFEPGPGSDAEVMAPKPQKRPRKLPEVPDVPSGGGDFLSTARHRLENAFTAESRNRIEALEDLRFIAGDQWPVQIRSIRLGDNRPCLTIPRINTFYSQVVSDLRKNRPSIQVDPVGSGADVEKAELLQGLIGHIEYQSKADLAYDSAAESASGIGFGFVRIATEYKRDSFDQEIRIKPIYNHFSVYGDPDAKSPDWEDCNYCFVTSEMNRWIFTQKYPNANPEAVGDLYIGTGDNRMRWWSEESVRIAEYYFVEETKETLHLLADGSSVYADEYEGDGEDIVKSRSTMRRKVKWCLMTGSEVLEGPKDWPGKYIPIVPMWGKIAIIEGQPWRWGLIRQAKDSQRMYNYWASAMTEHVALSPKAPFMGTKEQIQGYETEWMTANTKNVSFLPYKVTKDSSGQMIPPPQRIQNVPVPEGIVTAMTGIGADMQFVTGIFNPGIGNQDQGPESGKAILLRKTESDDANFIFADNQHRMLRMVGLQLLDLIPKIYDTQRDLRIVSPDGENPVTTVNQPAMNMKTGMMEILNDLTGAGEYDVRVEAGPSHTTQRQQAADAMMQLIQADPQAIPIVADQLLKNLDFPGAQVLSERFAKMMPPQLQEDQQLPPAVQQQFQQMQQHIQNFQQQIMQLSDENKTLKLENKNKADENQTKRDLGFAQIQASLAESFSDLKVQLMGKLADLEHDGAKHLLSEKTKVGMHQDKLETNGSVSANPRSPMDSPRVNEPNIKGVPYDKSND